MPLEVLLVVELAEEEEDEAEELLDEEEDDEELLDEALELEEPPPSPPAPPNPPAPEDEEELVLVDEVLDAPDDEVVEPEPPPAPPAPSGSESLPRSLLAQPRPPARARDEARHAEAMSRTQGEAMLRAPAKGLKRSDGAKVAAFRGSKKRVRRPAAMWRSPVILARPRDARGRRP